MSGEMPAGALGRICKRLGVPDELTPGQVADVVLRRFARLENEVEALRQLAAADRRCRAETYVEGNRHARVAAALGLAPYTDQEAAQVAALRARVPDLTELEARLWLML